MVVLARVQVYSQLEGEVSHVVNTAWAMLALIAAKFHEFDPRPLHRAAACLMRLQVRWVGTSFFFWEICCYCCAYMFLMFVFGLMLWIKLFRSPSAG